MQAASSGSNSLPYVLLSTQTNVPAGAIASYVWTNLQTYANYEWYVTVTDPAGGTTTSPLWRFTTAPNSAPTVSNRLITVYGDAPTNLTLIASDVNGDPLTFHTNTLPTHGLVRNFEPATGAFTYFPARGFRGVDFFGFSASDAFSTSGSATMNMNVISPPDTNGNGLPDGWEAVYGVTDPAADSDGDGVGNGQEYVAGTNPTNAASVLRLSSITRQTNGHFVLTWPSIGGTRYRLQYGNGIASAAILTDIVRPLGVELDASPYGSDSTQTFVDDFTLTPPPTNGARFYRVKVVP
jgi:hypothetical protein